MFLLLALILLGLAVVNLALGNTVSGFSLISVAFGCFITASRMRRR